MFLLIIALVAMPLFITACSEQKGGEVMGPQVTQTAQGFSDDPNMSSSRFPQDQCTWYAASEFDKVAPSPGCNWGGNAGMWVANAYVAGWQTFDCLANTPTVAAQRSFPAGTIVVWSGGSFGHVAVLRAIVQNGIYIQEQNWPLGTGVSSWRYLTWSQVSYRGSYRFMGYIPPWRR